MAIGFSVSFGAPKSYDRRVMTPEKTHRPKLKDALGKIYEHHPPYFREYLRRYQEDPASRVFGPLAEAYRRFGHLEEAIEICREGLKLHPDFHGGRITLARCYIDKRQFLDARLELEKVVQAVPENFLAQRLLGDSSEALGDIQTAIHSYKMALLLSPNDVGLSERVYHLEKSIKQESEVQESGPITAHAIFTDTKSDLVDTDEEEGFRVESFSEIFENKDFKKEITTETLGDLYLSQGQYEMSLKIFDKIYASNPSEKLLTKITLCREKLGVEKQEVVRVKKIEVLRNILTRLESDKD